MDLAVLKQVTHLESEVLEDVSGTDGGLVARATLDDDGNGRSRGAEAVLDAEDLDAGSLNGASGGGVRPAEGGGGAGAKERHGEWW